MFFYSPCSGYLYANLSYLDEHSCLVLLTVDSNKFYDLKTSHDLILSVRRHLLTGDSRPGGWL